MTTYALRGGAIDNPWALGGGLGGLVVTSLAILLAASMAHGHPAASPDDRLELEFLPGSLARLGSAEAPAQTSAGASTPANPTAAAPSVDTPPPQPASSVPATSRPARPRPAVSGGDPGSSRSHLPTVGPSRGSPFGDPHGWSDLTRSGDAWATSVLAEMSQMRVGAFAADLGQGDLRFQITVCKDGRIGRVTVKGGSLSTDARDAVVYALRQLELPRPPAAIAASMPAECARIDYTFVWTAEQVE